MPIDKMIPRFLVSDEDERLLKEGAMTDALNVTISEDGDGSEGVLKNVKGTTAITGATLGIGDDEVKVIGQVSDSQLGYIYFFVATDEADVHTHDAIYRVNTNTNATQLVFKNTWLNFNENGFVKADVLNADIARDGNVSSILYFTDNDNPPRKVNVNRAINGEYVGFTNSQLDLAISCIKPASTFPPTFNFETDSNYSNNNFKSNPFQFATQIIYKDGEESAISTYSTLAVTPASFYTMIEESGYGVDSLSNNVCVIKHNVPGDYPEVDKIRLLGRLGNDGNFFVIDDIDPNSNLQRDIFGSLVNVYDKNSSTYRFYNDRIGSLVEVTEVDKLYDNVPLKAQGQSLVSNRLMFSNYTEGRPNHSVRCAIDPVYSESITGNETFVSTSDYANMFAWVEADFKLTIDLEGSNSINSTTTIPAGSSLRIKFDFSPNFTVSRTDGYLISYEASALIETQSGSEYTYGSVRSQEIVLTNGNNGFVDYSLVIPSDMNSDEVADYVQELLDDYTFQNDYTVTFDSVADGQSIPAGSGLSEEARVSFKFGQDITATDDQIVFKPRIVSLKFLNDVGLFFDTSGVEVRPDNDDHANECWVGPLNTQGSNTTYSTDTNAPSEFSMFINTDGAITAFKAGASHSFGVVYYDKWGRNGFVNELGNAYVKYPSERGTLGKGPASIKFDFDSTLAPQPDWAEYYQIVYGGSSISGCFQYTVGGAYVKREPIASGDHPVDESDHKIYVSLKTLDIYRGSHESIRDYSFTKGDKLRIVSYQDDSLNAVYPLSSLNKVIEFDVVGTIIDPDDLIHIEDASHSAEETPDENPHLGTFLILSAPQVESTVGDVGSVNKYVGFDWYHLTGENYNATDTIAAIDNRWSQRVVVDVVTPKKSTEKTIYYEIGNRRKLGGYKQVGVSPHGPSFNINNGDIWFRPVSCKHPVQVSSAWLNVGALTGNNAVIDENPVNWDYSTIYLEDFNISDSESLKFWDRGRPHAAFEDAATIRRFNGITYSDAFVQGNTKLSTSSFNPSLGNFDTLDGKYGAIEYLGNYSDDLLALQEDKLCLIPVNKNILEYASGSADVAVSTNVLNQRRYSAGDYGCSNHPEAVLIQDNSVFFVDESRQAVCALTGGQLVPISDKSMSSFFENFFTNSHTKYVSGYDPRDNTYYLTGLGGTDNKYKTIGYDAARGVWQSRYSFTPDIYSNQNNMLYSAKYTSGDNLFWKHDSTTYNEFYGTEYPSEVQMVSKLSPSRVKVFNALSYEGDSALWDVSTNGIETDLGQITDGITEWDEREGSYYASMPRDKSDNSTSQKIFLGSLTDTGDGLTFTSNIRLSRQPIPLGNQTITQPSPGSPVTLNIASVSGNTITFGEDASGTAGDTYLILDSATNGDSMRGHWMKIKMQNSDTTKHELYCINTHITDSKSHHPLGG